jgi:hypothetical protein
VILIMVRQNIIQNLGWDLEHHEELYYSSDNRIHIWETLLRVSKKIGIFPVSYQRSSRMFQMGHLWGPHNLEGPHGPSGGAHAYMRLGHVPHKAHASSPRINPKGVYERKL